MSSRVAPAPLRRGLSVQRFFTPDRVDPFTKLKWVERDIRVKDWKTGETIFSQDRFKVPESWSENAGQIVASKYAFGPADHREGGVDQVIGRVAHAITFAGVKGGYFKTRDDAYAFLDELKHLCVHQYGAFNSPVWFNVGIYETRGLEGSGAVWYWNDKSLCPMLTHKSYVHPQTSACFIQSVEDSMESLMELATSEAMLFKHGSGTGTDLTPIRSTKEFLSTGGKPSGPVSFMRVYDRIASVIKSGGKTRRAAKMQTMHVSHPDIMAFIRAKGQEERKAKILIEKGGYDADFNGEAYDTVAFQNANLTVRIPDVFMNMLMERSPGEHCWPLIAVTTGGAVEYIDPHAVIDEIAQETWRCGDPGVQFSDTINSWHTCPLDKTGTVAAPINSSNPCSEYLFQDDSACNLASLRLTKFYRDGAFDVEMFRHAVRIFIIAQEILVDHGSYPTHKIAQKQHDFRTLGLGFADLGGLLMKMGLAYDSDAGRGVAGAIAALLTGEGYHVSAEMAKEFGAFEGFAANRDAMLGVIDRHKTAIDDLGHALRTEDWRRVQPIGKAAFDSWVSALTVGRIYGYRNAQISVIAPTGTIAFMMDCDTTGIEPALGLTVYKTLAGGGNMRIANEAVGEALDALGYSKHYAPHLKQDILDYIAENGYVSGCLLLKPEHVAVFDTALAPKGCDRFISYMGHLGMMAAVQPFISGAISKTVNVPSDFTPADITQTYVDAWGMGIKCVAIYRDASKASQPVTVDKPEDAVAVAEPDVSCINCNATILVAAGTCSVCPNCGTPQGGCS